MLQAHYLISTDLLPLLFHHFLQEMTAHGLTPHDLCHVTLLGRKHVIVDNKMVQSTVFVGWLKMPMS